MALGFGIGGYPHANLLWVFDPFTYEIQNTVTLPHPPLGWGSVVNNAGAKLYLTSILDESSYFMEYDIDSGVIRTLVQSSKEMAFPCISPDDSTIYISNFNQGGAAPSVLVVDTASMTVRNEIVLSTTNLPSSQRTILCGPTACTATKLYVPIWSESSPQLYQVVVYNTTDFSIVETITTATTDDNVYALYLSPDGNTLYIVTSATLDTAPYTIIEYDLTRSAVVSRLSGTSGSESWSPYLCLSSDGSLLAVPAATNTNPGIRVHLKILDTTGGLSVSSDPTLTGNVNPGHARLWRDGVSAWVLTSTDGGGSPYKTPPLVNLVDGSITTPITFPWQVWDIQYVCQKPTSVPVLHVVPHNNLNTLYWTAPTNAVSYTIKRSSVSGGPYTTIQIGHTGTTYNDTGLMNGTTYYYMIEADNACGSTVSNEAFGTPVALRRCVRLAEPSPRTIEQLNGTTLSVFVTMPLALLSQYAALIPNTGPDTLVINYTDAQGQNAQYIRSVTFWMSDSGYVFIGTDNETQFLVAGTNGAFFDANSTVINNRNAVAYAWPLVPCDNPSRYGAATLLANQVRPQSWFRDGILQ